MVQMMQVATEVSSLGDSTCVFRPDNHALCLLNDTAAMIWQARREGLHHDAIVKLIDKEYGIGIDRARCDIDTLIADWTRCGLLDNCSSGEPGKTQRITDPQQISKPAHLAKSYGVAGRFAIRLKCHEPVLASLLEAVLQPLSSDQVSSRTLEISEDNTGYWIAEYGQILARELERSHARRLVLQHVLMHRHCNTGISAILHASSVKINNKAVLIAGASGSGKTTLTAALVRAGADYLADDLVPLNIDGRNIGDFPVSLAVKQGSWPVVSDLYPELNRSPVLTTRRLCVRYLSMKKSAPHKRSTSIGALIFPQFATDHNFTAQRLSPETAFTALLNSGSVPEGAPLSVKSMTRLASNVPAWRITYSGLEEAVNWIGSLEPAP